MTTEDNQILVFKVEELTASLKKLRMVKQEHNFYNILPQKSIIVHSDIKQQPTCCEKKRNISSYIPDDVYMEINKCLDWPIRNKVSPNEATRTKEPEKEYTIEMFMLEENIFVLPERVKTMVKQSFELSFVSKGSQERFCLFCNENISDDPHKFYKHIRCLKHITYFKKMTQNQECFALTEQFMREVSVDYIKCYLCKVDVCNNQKAVQEHSKKKIHKQKSSQFRKHSKHQYNHLLKDLENCWYNVQMYACIPCNEKFQFKLNFLQHLIQVHRHQQNIMYDFCIPCATLWVVHEDKASYSYSIHCNNIMHKYLVNNLDFMVEEMPKHVKDLLNHAEETAEELFKLSDDILKNDLMQKELLQSLESSLCFQFPTLEIYPFGSRLTGLGFPNSDIDIFLDCSKFHLFSEKGDAYEQNDLSSSVYNLDITVNCLCKDEDNWVLQDILKQTRTPIIRLRHRLTGLQCDISFRNGLSVENTKLIRSFNEACPPCRKLILFVKKWLSSCCLPGRHCIINYALTWIVIFYLQINKFLPSIDTLIKKKNESRLISGWETGVDCAIPTVSIGMPFTKLLIGFFDFYGDFNYKDDVICPLLGYTVRKQDFINISNLPKAMSPYITYIKMSCNSEMFRIDSSICIQDPLDLSHNLTKAVQPLTLKAFKQYCKDSADILRKISHH